MLLVPCRSHLIASLLMPLLLKFDDIPKSPLGDFLQASCKEDTIQECVGKVHVIILLGACSKITRIIFHYELECWFTLEGA